MIDPSQFDCWIFDLDNTLYDPRDCDLFPEMNLRMTEFITTVLGIGEAEADALRVDYTTRYGTTLTGLMVEHDVDPDDFLRDAHDLDLSAMPTGERLAEAIARLPGRRLVHTNASREHAERVLARRGLAHLFEDIFDLAAANYVPKPNRIGYLRFLQVHGIEPGRAVMFEDMARNLVPAASLGMTTVWVRTERPSAQVGEHGTSVHHTADRLEEWLRSIPFRRDARNRPP